MATYTSSTMSTDNQYIKYRIQAITNSEDIVNSTTNVTFKIQAWRTNTGYTTYGTGTAYLVVGGTTYTASITVSQEIKYKNYVTLLTKTINVPRGEAGNASTYAKAKITHQRFTSSYQGYTFNFPVINRYALLSSVSDFTDESYPTISYTNPAGTDLVTDVKVRITWNSGANYTAWQTLTDDGSDSPYTFDSTSLTAQNIADMLASCPNSNTLAVKFDLQSTMSGTEYHHYKDAVMNVVNANPTANAITFQDTNSSVVAITGSNQVIVQNKSTLKIHIANATAKKSSSIASYSLVFNGTTYTPDENNDVSIAQPDVYGTQQAVVTITDSRGNITVATQDIDISQWYTPSADFTLARVNNFETDTILNVKANYATVTGSVLSITEQHRKKGTSSWSSASSVTDNTDTHITLDNQYEWEVLITVADSFASVQYTSSVGKGTPLLFYDVKRSSVGVNGFPDDDEELYVGGSIKATGKITCNKMSVTSGTGTFTKTSGSWTFNECTWRRSGNVVTVNIKFNGGGSNVAVGSNAIVGTINGVDRPPFTVRLHGYYSGTMLMGEYTSTGAFNVRILGEALNLATSNNAIMSGTFIVDD